MSTTSDDTSIKVVIQTITDNGGAGVPQADFDALIATLEYENTKRLPDESDRTFVFSVNDGVIESAVARSTINVQADHDLDGIGNLDDIDDDNDGILDVDEGTSVIRVQSPEKAYLFTDSFTFNTNVIEVDLLTGASTPVGVLPLGYNAVAINEADGFFRRHNTNDRCTFIDIQNAIVIVIYVLCIVNIVAIGIECFAKVTVNVQWLSIGTICV